MSKPARLAQQLDAEAPNTVLLVDDNAPVRQALVGYLSGIPGMRVETGSDHAHVEALLAFGGERFTCAVIDLQSCGPIDGPILTAIQAHAVPAIILTPAIDERLRQQLHAINVVDYIVHRQLADLEHVALLAGRLRENHQIKVIVADASTSSRTYVKELLDNHRYSTFAAANAREALSLLRRHPDASLAIIDFDSPQTGAAQLIEAIRDQYRSEQLSIIGLSDSAKPGTSARMIKAGANDFLSKPFAVEELYCRVSQNVSLINYARRLNAAATHDRMTGVFTRRHILEVGSVLYANACRGNVHLAAALINANDFAQISFLHGERAGEHALQAIAAVVQSTLRTGDVVGRYGDNIVCLTLIKQPKDAPIAFERLLQAVAAIDIKIEGVRIPMTVSVGVTTNRCRSLEEMIHRAQDALDLAKQAGDDRVVCL